MTKGGGEETTQEAKQPEIQGKVNRGSDQPIWNRLLFSIPVRANNWLCIYQRADHSSD